MSVLEASPPVSNPPVESKRVLIRTYFLVFLLIAAVVGGLIWHFLPLGWVVSGLLGANLAAFTIWAWDKRQAKKGGRRVPEWTLHLMAICGATPASLVAMQALRHKTMKKAFTVGYSVLFGAQLLALLLYFWPPSSS